MGTLPPRETVPLRSRLLRMGLVQRVQLDRCLNAESVKSHETVPLRYTVEYCGWDWYRFSPPQGAVGTLPQGRIW
jgi:hypothetical protein